MDNIWEAFALGVCVWLFAAIFVIGGLYIIKESNLTK